jgi:Tfp pilus assembly protein PilF
MLKLRVKPVEQRLEENNAQAGVQKYADRHYQRATQYANQNNWPNCVQELREAIKLEPKNSDYHALIGVAYFEQNFTGMATVYIRQALKLNPQHPVALKYTAKLNINGSKNPNPKSVPMSISIANVLSLFAARQGS